MQHKSNIMNEDKKYPQIDEENGSCVTANESALACATESVVEEDDIDYNFGDHDFGLPHTLEEVKAELREADDVWDNPNEWNTSEEMWAEIKQTFPWANIR